MEYNKIWSYINYKYVYNLSIYALTSKVRCTYTCLYIYITIYIFWSEAFEAAAARD